MPKNVKFQMPLKNARFEIFGILKCQLATLLYNGYNHRS